MKLLLGVLVFAMQVQKPPVPTQRIRVRLLNADSGKPMKGQRVALSWKMDDPSSIIRREGKTARTDKQGVVLLGRSCGGVRVLRWSGALSSPEFV